MSLSKVNDDSKCFGGEGKCVWDKDSYSIAGSLILWTPSMLPGSTIIRNVRSVPQDNNFANIPTKEYLNNISTFEWLDVVRKHVYCLIRAIAFSQKAGSSGIRLSPNCIGTTRHSAEASGTHFPFSLDAVLRRVIDLRSFKDWACSKKLIDSTMYLYFIESNAHEICFEQTNIKVDTPFDFTILKTHKSNSLPSEDNEPNFIIPSPKELQNETNIIVMGYPQLLTKKKFASCYRNEEENPSRDMVNKFFSQGWKTASLGKVKHVNNYHALISAASCTGMPGSPVFTFEGELVGFLIGSKSNCPFNIVILVSHPTFIIEYCIYCGNELLDLDSQMYGPKLASFISKHWEILVKVSPKIPLINKFVDAMKNYVVNTN